MLYSNMEPAGLPSTKGELNDIDKEKEKQARENHCEIERRRRVKMAAYFNELCSMVPTCNTLQRKPDKLTILRMASSHMRALRGHHQLIANDNTYKPSFLTDQELKYLILEAADGFLFVAQCDSGNIIYVSDAIQPVLCYSPNDWYQHSLFDFIHCDDLDKVKEQLSSQETNTIGRILDLKTGTVKKEGHPNSLRSHMGSRRAFICRIRVGNYHDQQRQQQQQQQHYNGYNNNNNNNNNFINYLNRTNIHTNALGESNTNIDGNNYAVVHITGYTKTWPPINNGQNSSLHIIDHDTNNNDNNNQSNNNNNNNQFCLIAIARIQVTNMPNDSINSSNIEFVTRLDQNGIITFVDQRITQILGYQSNDILKKSIYDLCVLPDQNILKEQVKLLYETKSSQPLVMQLHIKSINQEIYTFKTSSFAFSNPYNDEFEFIVCTHTLQKQNDLNNSVLIDQLNAQQTPTTTTTAINSNLINTYSTNNSTLQQQQQPHIDNTKQNYGNYMIPTNGTSQDTYSNTQTLYSNTRNLQTSSSSTPSSTTSSLSSTSSNSSTSTPPLVTQTPATVTPPTTTNTQFNIQRNPTSILPTWSNYDTQTTNSPQQTSTTTNTTVQSTTQYLLNSNNSNTSQYQMTPTQQPTPTYSDWSNTNHLMNNNTTNSWQQMNIPTEQHQQDLLTHHYQVQPQLMNTQQQQQQQQSNTNQNDYNYQYMTM